MGRGVAHHDIASIACDDVDELIHVAFESRGHGRGEAEEKGREMAGMGGTRRE